MSEQRLDRSRRSVVATAGAATGSALAGCLTGFARRSSAPSSGESDPEPVSILAAGSLQRALADGLTRAVDVPVRIEAHGSATVARLVARGKRNPDIVSVADTALFDSILHPPWYARFGSNSIVLAYNPGTAGGRRLERAGRENWYRPLLEGTPRLGRTDPDLDPLGYRTLFAFELASRYYDGVEGLRDRIPKRRQIYPETALLGRFETGAIDAAVVYRSMAVERGYDYIDLPDRIDLGHPDYVEDWYSTVSYTLPEGTTIRGGLISYGSTVRRRRQPVIDVFETLVTGTYLENYGFVLPDGYPHYEGDVPNAISN